MKIDRSSGILLHITSLPGKYGVGTIGREARDFTDFLAESGQSYWQILPVGPVEPVLGHSPYSSPSTFAGNWLFIDPESVIESEWFMDKPDISEFEESHSIDFGSVIPQSEQVLKSAFDDFFSNHNSDERKDFDGFCERSSFWLDDYALFRALADRFETNSWIKWPHDLSFRKPEALEKWGDELREEILFHKFVQYLFFSQWKQFKKYVNERGIRLIGDIPIYISMEGADAWAHPEILELDPETREPVNVAGVPPDYFSETGQRWGNPLYRWFDKNGNLDEKTFAWWTRRIAHLTGLVDILRIDHFRGFEGYWSIPAGEKNAVKGEWMPGPKMEFFTRLREELGDLPLIAEDLGVITPEVDKLRDDLGLPGMKIFQFAFDLNSDNYYLPHNLTNPNCVLYTGTHDNNTTNGWFYGDEIDDNTREYILEYLGVESRDDFHWKLIRQAFRTVANLVIVPAQDLLGFGEEHRMNKPSTVEENWQWKLTSSDLTDELAEKLLRLGRMYRRAREKKEKEEDQPKGSSS